MKKIIHTASSRGHANHGWLRSYHSFSFAGYYDPERMGFGLLRVLNDDTVEGGMGFGQHPHSNMEIISIPLQGKMVHQDTTGNKKVIGVGEVQIMSAGTGLQHSEYNESKTEDLKFLQIWIFPKEKNIPPRYEQKFFNPADATNRWQLVVSPDEDDEAVLINQDAWISLARFDKDMDITYELKNPNNGAYIFILEGSADIEGEQLTERDAIGIWDAGTIDLKAKSGARVLVIEVPMG